MKIEIYDPVMRYPIGVCGPGVDPELVRIYDALRQIQKQAPEVRIERYGLTSDPQVFVANAVVSELLKSDGPECLPLGFIDGELVSKSSYPDNTQLAQSLQNNGHTVTLGGEKTCKAGCC